VVPTSEKAGLGLFAKGSSSSKEEGLLTATGGGGKAFGFVAGVGAGVGIDDSEGAGGKSALAVAAGVGGGGKFTGLLGGAGVAGGENSGAFLASPSCLGAGGKGGSPGTPRGGALTSLGGGTIGEIPIGGGANSGLEGAKGGIEGFNAGGGAKGGISAFLGLGGNTKAGGAGLIDSFGGSTLAGGGGKTPGLPTGGGGIAGDKGGILASDVDAGALFGAGAENKEAKTSTPVFAGFGSPGLSTFAGGGGKFAGGGGKFAPPEGGIKLGALVALLGVGGAKSCPGKFGLESFTPGGAKRGTEGAGWLGGENREFGADLGSSGATADKVSSIIGSGSSSNFLGGGAAVFSLKASGKINPGVLTPNGSAFSKDFGADGGENKEFSKLGSEGFGAKDGGNGPGSGLGGAGENKEFSKKSSTLGAFGETALGGAGAENTPPGVFGAESKGLVELAPNKFSGAEGKTGGGGAIFGAAES
jgi:hypothetical protein